MEKFKIPKIVFEDSTERYNLDINTLPFVSEFKILSFKGRTDFQNLVAQFDINEISGNSIVIKSIKFIKYNTEQVNILATYVGGLDTLNFTNPGQVMLLPGEFLNETYSNSGQIEFTINDRNIIFRDNTIDGYGISKDYENIYAYFPEKIQKINFKVMSQYYYDVPGQAKDNLYIKVIIECYLL